MKKLRPGLAAGLLFAAGVWADTTWIGGLNKQLTNSAYWTRGQLPVDGVMGQIGRDGHISIYSRFPGWTVTQTGGMLLNNSNAITLNGGVKWFLQGGSLVSPKNHIRIGFMEAGAVTGAEMTMTGGMLEGGRQLQVTEGRFAQSGGTLKFGQSAVMINGSTVDVSGGTGAFNTIGTESTNGMTLAGSGTLVTFSGGAWTVKGNLQFGTNLRSVAMRFAAGNGELTADSISFLSGGYIDFTEGSGGKLTIKSCKAADFEKLWSRGKIWVNGAVPRGSFSDLFAVEGNTLRLK